jgi:hypothetical protein
MLLVFVMIAMEPDVVPFVLFLIYIASGPGLAIYGRLRTRLKKTPVNSEENPL